MAVAMSGGPVLGGVIVDLLGWRWCFYVCVPIAVVALILLQRTLHVTTVRKENVSIDWFGATLITAAVSVLLVWVSFAGKAGYYEWISVESALYVGAGIVLLVATLIVETKVADPIIPLKIVTERTTGLAIIASVAVGIGLFGATTFLGQYFQTSRAYSPTVAGLLTIDGRRHARLVDALRWAHHALRQVEGFLIGGAILQMVGFGLLGTVDHLTSLTLISVYIAIVGLGTGMLMQNLVLAVQNTVSVRNIGAASSSVAFFRTFGGAIGVSVLGSILASRVATISADGLAKLGVDTSGGGSGGSLDFSQLPEPVAEVIRAAYGDATATLFLVAAAFAVVTLVAVVLIPNQALRTTIDLVEEKSPADRADISS